MAITKEQLINLFKEFVENEITDWRFCREDNIEDMEELAKELQTADDYFYNNFENFISDNDLDNDTEWLDEFDEIIENAVEDEESYLYDKYEHWNGIYGDYDFDEYYEDENDDW